MLALFQSLGAGAALLLVFLVWANPKGNNRSANKWLASFLSCVFLLMLEEVFINQNLFDQYPHLIGFPQLAIALLPCLLYLSVSFFVAPTKKFQYRDLKHFAFFLLMLVFALPDFFSSAEEKLQSYYEEHSAIDAALNYIFMGLYFIYLFYYWHLSHRKLIQHEQNTQLYSAANEDIQLKWLKYFSYILLVMLILWGLSELWPLDQIRDTAEVIYFIGVFVLAYYAVEQENIFPKNEVERREINAILLSKSKATAEKAALMPAPELTEKSTALQRLMKEQRPYLDNELNLAKLASLLDVSVHQLSYIINEGIGDNFSNFINAYRLETAKTILSNPQMDHFSMLQVAFEAGYNSKTVFNTHFKKCTGLSPTAFKQQHNVKNS